MLEEKVFINIMGNTKKKDNIILDFKSKVSLKDTVADLLSSELQILEERSKSYHKEESLEDNIKRIGKEFTISKQEKAEGIINFTIPKEKVGQKNATIIQKDQTTRKVPLDELPDIINNNKSIRKVVIEEIGLSDVKRTQLHFEQQRLPVNERLVRQIEAKQEAQIIDISPTPEKTDEKETAPEGKIVFSKPKAKRSFSSQDFEHLINNDFMDGSQKQSVIEQTIMPEKTISEFNFTLKSDQEQVPVIEKKTENATDSSSGLFLVNQDNATPIGNSFKATKTEYQRKKEISTKSISNLYYKTKKHNELFKLGTLFYRDLESGLKSFGFTCQGSTEPQQNTILGLSAYFSYHMKTTTTVFTETFANSVYCVANKEYTEEKILIAPNLSINSFCYQDMRIIEFCELQSIVEFGDTDLLEEGLEKIIDNSELLFWDLPTPHEMEKTNELFFPITRLIDNVSLVVKPNNSKIKDIVHLKEYFEKYHIQIKGMIMSEQEYDKDKS